MDKCKHCAESIESPNGRSWIHATGTHRGKARCSPDDSGLSYGYSADPDGGTCTPTCIGAADVNGGQ